VDRHRKILVSWYTDPRHIPPFSLSDRQINIGPQIAVDQPRMMYAGWTPIGAYDLKAVLEPQNIPLAFDAIVVWADATRMNMPKRLRTSSAPTLIARADGGMVR
jgi:hypothetical protein